MAPMFCKSVICFFMLMGSWSAKPPIPHPLHVSTTDISYNAQDGKLEVICTIFTDDFEAALTKQNHTHIDLTKPNMHAAMDNLVKSYMGANVHIKTTAAPLAFYYVGYEISKEAVNVYFESEKTPTPKKIDTEISLLHNQYNDQINIIHMTVNRVRKSDKLEYPDMKLSQVF